MMRGQERLPGELQWRVVRRAGADEARVCGQKDGRGEWARERRQHLAWERFLKWARWYAGWRLGFVRWRGSEGGVPPEGFDAESVAMEAVMTAGMAREGGEWRRDRKGVARAIRRLVDRLKHRREVWCTVSEADCKRVVVDKDEETEEAVKQAEQVPDAGRRPGEELAEWERIHQFEAYLEPDREAQELVECYCGNVSSPREIARLTGLTCREVKNARERVQAKWKRFRRMECKAKVRIPYPEEASHVGQNQARFEVTTY